MKKSRRRSPKRSGRGGESQVEQKLSRQIRELYGSEHEPQDDLAWDEIELPAASPKVRRRRQSPSPGAVQAAVPGDSQEGQIIELTSGSCQVESAGQRFDCVLPSRLARDQQASVAVGDRVCFQPVADRDGGLVYRLSCVLPRRTTLSRPDPLNPRLERVIAANIDLAVHVASVVEPPLRLALIDRYLIAVERGGATPVICVNKIDLLQNEERRQELAALDLYRSQGIPIMPCSVRTGMGIEALRNLLQGRTAVFVGHSGVGKSSLLNALDPELTLATGAVDRRGGKGTHTTTRSSLYRLQGDLRLIDTPGIREFGLWKLSRDELDASFVDLAVIAEGCHFKDCTHLHEPRCAVREAVEQGEISAERFAAYSRLFELLDRELKRT